MFPHLGFFFNTATNFHSLYTKIVSVRCRIQMDEYLKKARLKCQTGKNRTAAPLVFLSSEYMN